MAQDRLLRILKSIVGCASPKASRTLLCLIALLLVSSTGCAFRRVNLKEQLANQGPQALSAENPYVAANQLLAEEVEGSSTLRGFVSIRGTPDALEVKKDLAANPIIQLYYLDKTESYVLERLLNDWVIKGPDTIPREFLGSFFGVIQTEGKAPLVLSGEVVRQVAAPRFTPRNPTNSSSTNGGQRAKPSNSINNNVSQPTPLTENVAVNRGVNGGANSGANPPVRSVAPPSPVNMTANESLSGDVMHTVQFQGETLRIISIWYTGSVENAERLGRINGLTDPNHMELGQVIRIPRYLTRNTRPLTEQDVQKLIAARARS